jgi:acetyl esterase/lipase
MPSIRSHFWRFIFKRLANYKKPLRELRLKFEKDTRFVTPPKDVRVTQLYIEGVPAEWLEPTQATPNKVLLYLHRDGYVIGSNDKHGKKPYKNCTDWPRP